MKKKNSTYYDLIVIGSGSATNLIEPIIEDNPKVRIAIIDKDEPGGICLTRGCIPSKILLYPAELVRLIEEARELGVEAEIKQIDFQKIMERMRNLIGRDIESIRQGLSHSENIDYYHDTAEFVAPYTFKILGTGEIISGKMIFLSLGSKTIIPAINGLEETGYLTSDTAFQLRKLPSSIAIVGGGYIAAEFGHFFASMGSSVTIIGRNERFLPQEEPEVSDLARRVLGKHMKIVTGYEVTEVTSKRDEEVDGTTKLKKKLTALNRKTNQTMEVEAEEIMIASGRGPLSDLLHPERGGIRVDEKGWIKVNEYFETSQPNVWSFGDADGKYLFRHVANYESEITYYDSLLKKKVKADYHAVPHAVFTYPEIASVGIGEVEAAQRYGEGNILIGFYRYEDTAKGEAINARDYFVKVIVENPSMRILGAHIIGPEASVLIQEIINVMYAPGESVEVIMNAMHIHPALPEVVQRACGALMPLEHYRHSLKAQV